MNPQWVDCYIDKLLTLFPGVPTYAAMIDRWAFRPKWSGDMVDADLSRVLATEAQLLAYYGICRSFESGWIDEALSSGNKVLLPCDLFHLPHAKVFYGKEHAGHYILVRSVERDGSYVIFDDHPAYSGTIDRSTLQRAHDALGLPYHRFAQEMLEITDDSSISYVFRTLKPDSFYLGDFANRLLHLEEEPLRKCSILKGTRHFYHRFQGFIRMVEAAPLCSADAGAAVVLRNAIAQYMDNWRATVNLATRALILPEQPLWNRIELRLAKHLEEEAQLPQAVAQFLTLLQVNKQRGVGS